MFESLLIAALLSVADPAGDAVGGGSLQAPTAAVYRNLAPFDLRQVTVTDDPQLTLVIELESLANPFELPHGFSLPVIEIYLEGDRGVESELLAGSGMRLPPGRAWEVAVRLTGEEAIARRATSDGLESVVPDLDTDGNRIIVRTPYPRPNRPRLYAMTGLYDLFGASPWRPVDQARSPWAFSGEQAVAVVDVLARDEATQRQSIETGVLLAAGGGRVRGRLWLLLTAFGLLLALAGVVMRTVFVRGGARLQGASDAVEDRGDDGRDDDRADERVDSVADTTTVGSAGSSPGPLAGSQDGAEAEAGAQSGSDSATDTGPDVAPFAGTASRPDGGDEAPLGLEGTAPSWPSEGPRRKRGRVVEVRQEEPAESSPVDSIWDSSALLSDADDEDFAEEFPEPDPPREADAWIRPVPLRHEEREGFAAGDEEAQVDELTADDIETESVADEERPD